MALQMLHKPMQKVPNFAEPPRQQQPISIPPMAGPAITRTASAVKNVPLPQCPIASLMRLSSETDCIGIGNFRIPYRFRPKFQFRNGFRFRDALLFDFGFGLKFGFGRSLIATLSTARFEVH